MPFTFTSPVGKTGCGSPRGLRGRPRPRTSRQMRRRRGRVPWSGAASSLGTPIPSGVPGLRSSYPARCRYSQAKTPWWDVVGQLSSRAVRNGGQVPRSSRPKYAFPPSGSPWLCPVRTRAARGGPPRVGGGCLDHLPLLRVVSSRLKAWVVRVNRPLCVLGCPQAPPMRDMSARPDHRGTVQTMELSFTVAPRAGASGPFFFNAAAIATDTFVGRRGFGLGGAIGEGEEAGQPHTGN